MLLTLDDLLLLKEQAKKPLIITHCGSTSKAKDAFEEWRLKDTLAGMIVLTIGASKDDIDLGISPEQAVQLDTLHLFKIDMADIVRILNINGYIGESTRRELEYARRLEKPILFLEQTEGECTHALLR